MPRRSLASLLLCAAAVAVASAEPVPDVVRVSTGLVRGVRDDARNVRHFLGVPFAEDAGGANRFAPPVPKKAWEGTLDATAFGHGCYSVNHNPDAAQHPSEDCLNLNVYVPAHPTVDGPLPVETFFYGGSFAEGDNTGAFGMYNASYAAATRNVVVVEPNYRLGLFGFFVTAEPQGTNFGLRDQVLALKWVQENIAAFGGDPSSVTIQGERYVPGAPRAHAPPG